MEIKPLVTIVIPVFNGSNFMREAIDCALNQTYDDIEVIVVNDGSTDNGATDKIARSYGDRIRYISKENGGVSSALNVAIENMRGEWFSWLSHDDLYYPDKIKKQVDFINNLLSKDSTIDLNKIVIHSATESINKYGKVIKIPSYKDIPEKENGIDVILNNVYNYRLSGCSFMIPRVAFKNLGGFREDIRTVSDVEYWYRLLFAGYQFYCLSNDILVKNRSHGKQVGKTKVSLFDEELNDLYISIADQLSVNKQFNTANNYKILYFGLVKRKIKRAARYTKELYLKGKISFFDYFILVPMNMLKWNMIGSCRNIARNVYRRYNVR